MSNEYEGQAWTKIERYRCPHCRGLFELGLGSCFHMPATGPFSRTREQTARELEQTFAPQAGDLTICPNCVSVLRFALHRRAHKLERIHNRDVPPELIDVVWHLIMKHQRAP